MTGADTGKVAVVSGGSRGLGREVTERLLRQGWSVATFSREPNEFCAATAGTYGDRFLWCAADLAARDDLRHFLQRTVDRFDRVDLLVNNAAQLRTGLFVTMPAADLESQVLCNVLGPITLAQHCARIMMRHRRGGVILNVSSINALRGHRGVAVYSATKAALDGLSRSLARELGPRNIRVNSIVPGFFDSDMTASMSASDRQEIVRRTPLRRLTSVGAVADAVLFLASPQAAAVTGQTFVIDGGLTC